jgi:hypothetical protein
MRAKILFVVANIASFGITGEVAHAGLINLTSTVNISFEYEDPGPLEQTPINRYHIRRPQSNLCIRPG